MLITIDKLDKIGVDGVIAELRERGVTPDAVAALEAFFVRPMTLEWLPFGEAAIRKMLPPDPDPEVVAELVALGEAVGAARGGTEVLIFDPFLVRGMGYYTGPIFELAHPSVPYSLGGGGRYDGMIGRFLGSEVPATGFSLGFERLVDLVEPAEGESAASVALVYDADVPLATLLGTAVGGARGGQPGATGAPRQEHQAAARGSRGRGLHELRVRDRRGDRRRIAGVPRPGLTLR